MDSGVEYVIASYGVIGFTLVIYLVVAAMKRARLLREEELLERLESRAADAGQSPPVEADAASQSPSVEQ